MAGKHGVHTTRTVGWHPRSLVLLAWIEAEIKRRRAEGSRAPQGDLLEEGMEFYWVACEQAAGVHGATDVPVAWRPPAGGKLRARLNRHARATGWPVNGLITEAVRRFLDEEAPETTPTEGKS